MFSSPHYGRLKRLFDVTGALTALICLAPVLLLTAAAVAGRLGRPVFFRQNRPGLHGKTFSVLKFRSMLEVDESRGIVTDAQRLTRFGSILRSSSLDELPNLINIFRGDMSFVGPRPSLCRYLDLYSPEQNRRHDALPGLTGLAQVNGRNALPWEDRLRMDVEYVDSQSLRLDLAIMLKTVVVVLRREGIATPGHVSSDEFRGTPEHAVESSAQVLA